MVFPLVEHAGDGRVAACSVGRVSDGLSVRILSGDDVRGLVTLDDVVHSQREVFRAFHRGEAVLAQRALLAGPEDSVAFAYLARASSMAPPVVKIGSVNPRNSSRDLPGIHAQLLVMDANTGALCAIVDGEAVTLLRTAAATTVAIQALVAGSPRRVSIIGSGPLALEHLRFLRQAFPRCDFAVQVRSEQRSRAFIDIASRAAITVDVTTSVAEAVAGAEVVITATNSVEPVVRAELLAEPAEQALHAALQKVKPLADQAFESGDYTGSLKALAALKAPVDEFFDKVMVNAEDAQLRANRQGLLALLHATMNRAADLSRLAA